MENPPPEDSGAETDSEVVINSPEELVEFYEYALGWRGLEFNQTTGQWMLYDQSFDMDGDLVEGHPVFRTTIKANAAFIGTFTVTSLETITERVLEQGGRLAFPPDEGLGSDSDIITTNDNSARMRFLHDPKDNMFSLVEFFTKKHPRNT